MTSCFYNILESFTGNKVNILSNFPDIISQNQPENFKKKYYHNRNGATAD